MSSLFIVIPAYNEAENIERTVSEWYPIVESHNKEGQSRLVIINDGSKDNMQTGTGPPSPNPPDQAKRRPRFHCSLRLPLRH